MVSSMAKDGRLRKSHRQDWPRFLNRVIPARVWQDFLGHSEGVADHRERWTAKYAVLCWTIMGWSLQGPLTERFREARKVLGSLFPSRRRPGSSYQGMVKATERVGVDVFHRLWCCIRPTLQPRAGRLWEWYGWTVMAVDGSRIDAPRTARNERALGIAGRAKTHPQWWVTWIVHLPTNLLWDWRQGPGGSSERSHLRAMLGDLPSRTLLLGDIGFGGFDLLGSLQRGGIDFIIRCGGGMTTLLIDGTVRRIERLGQGTVYLWPIQQRRHKPLRLRLIVLKQRGKRVYLLTNVMETTRLSRAMAGVLYRARWGIEVGYRALKQTLGRRKLRAKTPEPGAMELAGNILAMAILMLHAAVALRARVVRVSVANTLRVIRDAIAKICWRRPITHFIKQLRAAVRDNYVRKRSKQARDWPHKKNEKPPGAPKFRRLNRLEKEKILLLLNQTAIPS